MSEAYIQKSFKVLEDQYQFMANETAGLDPDTSHFVSHVLVSTIHRLNNRADSLASPISSLLIRKELPKARVLDARERGLVNITPHSTLYGLCREFEITPSLLQGFIDAGAAISLEQYRWAEKVNLFTGERMRAAAKSRLYDDHRHSEPPVITEAIKIICGNGCFFNLGAIEHHLDKLKDKRDHCAIDFGPDSAQYARANGRYINDFCCSRSIIDQNPTATSTPGIFAYVPAYFVASTGRIQQYRGGLQSCSRQMKYVAYSGVPGLRNYDLKASQLNALVLELIEAALDPVWLLRYLDTPDAKYVYADMVGISADCWKECLLALVMGAPLPTAMNEMTLKYYSIMRLLVEEAEGDLDLAEQFRSRFARAVAPLVEQLNAWHKYLVGRFLESKYRRSKRGEYIQNQVGKRLYLNELSLKGQARKAKAKLSAFLLQGREAAFIHTLTALSRQYGFKPIGNEHDGLVVIGKMPDAAIEKAAGISGFEKAEMIEKPFV